MLKNTKKASFKVTSLPHTLSHSLLMFFLTLIVVVKLAQKENGKTERERVAWLQVETKI
jgi:hypothetical protein